MSKIAVIYGSSRPSKTGKAVATWFEGEVEPRDGVEIELVDLAELNLPLIAETMPPMMGQYEHESTKEWSEKVGGFDGFVFVVAEYNHSFTPILKNALDTIYAEWNDKPAALVSYGAGPASDAVKGLDPVMRALKLQVVEPSFHVAKVFEAIDEDGKLKSDNVDGDSPQEVYNAVAEQL